MRRNESSDFLDLIANLTALLHDFRLDSVDQDDFLVGKLDHILVRNPAHPGS